MITNQGLDLPHFPLRAQLIQRTSNRTITQIQRLAQTMLLPVVCAMMIKLNYRAISSLGFDWDSCRAVITSVLVGWHPELPTNFWNIIQFREVKYKRKKVFFSSKMPSLFSNLFLFHQSFSTACQRTDCLPL